MTALDLLNNTARGIGFLVLGAVAGWIIVSAIDSFSRSIKVRRARRRQKQWRDFSDEP